MALLNKDAQDVLGMVARGDKRHDIAAWFGENQARIAEVESGEFGNLKATPSSDLPPKGAPGPKGRKLKAFAEKALAQIQNKDYVEAEKTLKLGIQKFLSHE